MFRRHNSFNSHLKSKSSQVLGAIKQNLVNDKDVKSKNLSLQALWVRLKLERASLFVYSVPLVAWQNMIGNKIVVLETSF